MYFGELAEKTIDFQNGHVLGGKRMAEHLIRSAKREFDGVENQERIMAFLQTESSKWAVYCMEYGMGKGEAIYFDGKKIPFYTDFPGDTELVKMVKNLSSKKDNSLKEKESVN